MLTDGDLERHPDERRALEGVVQTLLLTSHLLFVGFSLTDKNFLAMAEAVSKVRARAQDRESSKPGTALALTPKGLERAKYKDLDMLSMGGASSAEGARVLEIFLDRLVWAASTESELATEYLLDRRYASGLSERDRALQDLLVGMVETASPQAKSSSGWTRVEECLRSLGYADTAGGSPDSRESVISEQPRRTA